MVQNGCRSSQLGDLEFDNLAIRLGVIGSARLAFIGRVG